MSPADYSLTDEQAVLLASNSWGSTTAIEAVRALHEARNADLIAGWQHIAPDADAAVLEVTIRAAGRPRRRLLSRLSYCWRKNLPGWVQYRAAHPFSWLTYHTIEAALLSAASDTELTSWRLVGEPMAWSHPPSLT